MRIKQIEYENFRNFKERGKIVCSTDGKVTIIYGKNGDGKTTLHQLLQWIFYGEVHFNKTTTDKLYNLSFESEMELGEVFETFGRIDFEHDGQEFSLTRINRYKKALFDSEKLNEEVFLNKMDSDNNWKRMERPHEVIEKLLPSGLSEYFFFDGESMIADLRVKGKDSASKLRKALYSMFDLDVLESAINHIGRTDLKSTVLGKLYLSKGNINSDISITQEKAKIEKAQQLLEQHNKTLEELNNQKVKCKKVITDASEKIGSNKSKEQYEVQRKQLKQQAKLFLENAACAQSDFGAAVMEMFPKLLIAKSVEDARKKIHLQVDSNNLPLGLNRTLVDTLLDQSSTTCICGNELCENERAHIREYIKMLPPYSYTKLYNEFNSKAKNWGKGFDVELLERYIRLVLDNQENAETCDANRRILDEDEKKSQDIEDLVVARQQAEEKIIEIDKEIVSVETEIKKLEIYIKARMKEFDRLTQTTEANQLVSHKIEIMTEVLDYFSKKLQSESISYSKNLEDNIQLLLNRMLTSERKVAVSHEFSVRVTDTYGDESKSEGQFAVVSFAYIGGILKMLQSEERLEGKEYPLVLDGPFSKLDPDQRQNVIDTIPKFAPQVILFSKDDLQGLFDENDIGKVWTIQSNAEKNVATVKEGYLWK